MGLGVNQADASNLYGSLQCKWGYGEGKVVSSAYEKVQHLATFTSM